jgi:hypothetical protein
MLRLMEITPVTLKSRADHTDGDRSSQDCVLTGYTVDLAGLITAKSNLLWSNRRSAIAGWRKDRSCAGLAGLLG